MAPKGRRYEMHKKGGRSSSDPRRIQSVFPNHLWKRIDPASINFTIDNLLNRCDFRRFKQIGERRSLVQNNSNLQKGLK